MIDEAILAQMNGEYVMPEDAGPAWRAARAAGMDISLIEENLQLGPWERLVGNAPALALAQALQTNGTVHQPAAV